MAIKWESTSKTGIYLWIFFALAYLLSWVLWIPASLLNQETLRPLAVLLYFTGGFGPSLAGVIMIDRTQDKDEQAGFLRRLFNFKQISGAWYAFIFLFFPLMAALTSLAYWLIQGSLPPLPSLSEITRQPEQLLILPAIFIQVLLAGPLSEEIGWRGFALDNLQKRWKPFPASLLLGALWALWHTPLFFIKGTMYNDWGFGTVVFWLFLLRMILLSLLITWVYNKNRSSILSAILLHFTYNFTFGFFHPAPVEVHLYGTMLFILLISLMIACKQFSRPASDNL